MRVSWSVAELPANSGRPVTISAKMQPADHRSIGVLYLRLPISTSGARYHSVTTYPTTASSAKWSNQKGLVLMKANLMCVASNRDAKRSSKTKVGQLQFSTLPKKEHSIRSDRETNEIRAAEQTLLINKF
jgi:hypothetical protein